MVFDDLEELLASRLGGHYDAERVRDVLGLARSLRTEKEELEREVRRGTISGRIFAERVNDLLHTYLARIATVLGPDDYERVFDVRPDERLDIANPEIAASVNYRR